jgi:ABC-type uncharacterized transport system substrate-binding protein
VSSNARRRFLVGAGLALGWAGTYAQNPRRQMPRIGFLGAATPAAWQSRIEAFREGLRDLGYVEGKNIAIEFRFAEGRYERLAELAEELVRLRVDVIVTHAAPGALAAKQATATQRIPVVMTNVGDAVGWGIVKSLARPGGNITGDTFFITELVAKRLEVLKRALPGVQRVAVLANPDNPRMSPSVESMDRAAKELQLVLLKFDARRAGDLERVFSAMAADNVQALALVEDVVLIANSSNIAARAAKQRLPSIGFVEFAQAGGLFGYGVDFLALYRRAPVFVDRILKGAKPGDIPVERPTQFEFVLNRGAAKALGVALPTALRPDREIE